MNNTIWNSTSMDNLSPEAKAQKAIRHVLNRIEEHPEIGYYLGIGTESFALLTEADATFNKADVELTRKRFAPMNARNPYEGIPEAEESTPDLTISDKRFFTAMERELVANRNKGNWQAWKPDRITCIDELFDHLRKLVRSLRYNDPDNVTEHAADLANVAAKTAAEHGNLEEK